MNILKKFQELTKNISSAPEDAKYIKEKKDAIRLLIDETNTTLVPTQQKIDEKLQELKNLKESIIHSTIAEFHTHLLEIKDRGSFGFEEDEFNAIITSLHSAEEEIVESKSIDIVQKLNTHVTYIERLNSELTKDEVDYYHSQAVEHSLNIENIINNYSEIIRLIYNTIALIKRYEKDCNKFNKQTDHIKEQLGVDYTKYNDEQKFLLQKHIYYMSKLLKLINSPVMLMDGSFNTKMIDILTNANKFLNDADEIEFVNFKKKTSLWSYIIPSIVLIGSCFYVIYYFSTN